MKKELFTLFLVSTLGTAASAESVPMPPRFILDTSPQQVLSEYPLGVVPAMAAYAHHGHPHHKITLPNGLEGWVYEGHGAYDVVSYRQSDGPDESTVVEEHQGFPRMSYTLVFSIDGKVIDVLYDDSHGLHEASALQIQHSADARAQKIPGVEHGPHFPPGGPRTRY